MVQSSSQKPHLLKIIPPPLKSIVIKGDDIVWNNPWHYHPEIELLYCISGRGTNFVGNSIRSIEEGEVLLIGKNLPHTRQRDKDYYISNPEEIPKSIVVQFKEDFLGDRFLQLPEFQYIQTLLNSALRGMKFTGKTCEILRDRLQHLKTLDAASSILDLISILQIMALSDEFYYLNTENFKSTAHEKSSQKINKVYLYTVEHFIEPITLSDVAALTNHSTAAFCRYFKTRTRKSYFQYLTEIRIAYACELLMEDNFDIAQVCYASGFNNLSHFHKQFKRSVKLTPTEYRARGRLKIPN